MAKWAIWVITLQVMADTIGLWTAQDKAKYYHNVFRNIKYCSLASKMLFSIGGLSTTVHKHLCIANLIVKYGGSDKDQPKL